MKTISGPKIHELYAIPIKVIYKNTQGGMKSHGFPDPVVEKPWRRWAVEDVEAWVDGKRWYGHEPDNYTPDCEPLDESGVDDG